DVEDAKGPVDQSLRIEDPDPEEDRRDAAQDRRRVEDRPEEVRTGQLQVEQQGQDEGDDDMDRCPDDDIPEGVEERNLEIVVRLEYQMVVIETGPDRGAD